MTGPFLATNADAQVEDVVCWQLGIIREGAPLQKGPLWESAQSAKGRKVPGLFQKDRISAQDGIAPVRRGHPAYPYMRDADGDGVVCER